eukprot:2317747-Pleurochrysis_carterae.AAC.3
MCLLERLLHTRTRMKHPDPTHAHVLALWACHVQPGRALQCYANARALVQHCVHMHGVARDAPQTCQGVHMNMVSCSSMGTSHVRACALCTSNYSLPI